MQSTTIDERFGSELRDDLVDAASSSGCEILEAEFRSGTLQVILDHPEGTTLAHCEEVSRKISALLDVIDGGDHRYVLEVSSPGLDRKLYGRRDFDRFAGRLARVTWIDPQSGKRTDIGRLRPSVEDDADILHLALDATSSLDVAMKDISEARLEIEI